MLNKFFFICFCVTLGLCQIASMANAQQSRTFEILFESLEATEISGGEPGIENEFFGAIYALASQGNYQLPNIAGIANPLWNVDEDNAISLREKVPYQVGKSVSFTVPADNQAGFKLLVVATLMEDDTLLSANDDLGTKSVVIPIEKFDGSEIEITGFRDGNDRARMVVSVHEKQDHAKHVILRSLVVHETSELGDDEVYLYTRTDNGERVRNPANQKVGNYIPPGPFGTGDTTVHQDVF